MKNQRITAFYKTVKNFKKKLSQKLMETSSITHNEKPLYHLGAEKQICRNKRSNSKCKNPQKQFNSIHLQIIQLKSKSQFDTTTLGPDFKIYESDNFVTRTPEKNVQSSVNTSASYVNVWQSPSPPPLPPKNILYKPPPPVIRKQLSYC